MRSKLIAFANSKEEKENLAKYFLEHRFIFDTLVKLIAEEQRLLIQESESIKRYENPSWAYLQADYLGAKRAYDKVIDLLTLDSSKTSNHSENVK